MRRPSDAQRACAASFFAALDAEPRDARTSDTADDLTDAVLRHIVLAQKAKRKDDRFLDALRPRRDR